MAQDSESTSSVRMDARSRHLLIAGTGRAGTSFLVRYLTELGLDTSLSRRGESGAFWDEAANAGLEELAHGDAGQLPYVVKSPWIGEYIEQILADSRLRVDAILIPVRDLTEAATSRAILETRAMHQQAPWMAEMNRTWEVWANTPGGVVYSLNPLDQARLLAVSFHNLVWRATEAEVPVHFLAFPRMIEDKDYLFRALRPILPGGTTAEQAHEAHARIADANKVRVGHEVRGRGGHESYAKVGKLPDPSEIDAIALRREVVRLRDELQRASSEAAMRSDEATDLRSKLIAENSRTQMEAARADNMERQLATVLNSKSWLATAPFRAVRSALSK